MSNKDTQFKRGNNANPNGRPKKGTAITDVLRKYADLKVTDLSGDSMTRKEALAKTLWGAALEGDLVAVKYVYDRIDGKPRESVDIDQHTELTITVDIEE